MLDPLREAAFRGKEAPLCGDLSAFGNAMIMNTEAQNRLHPELVGERSQQVIGVARNFIEGYKVNGAGGIGGSVTLLMKADTRYKNTLIDKIQKLNSDFRNIPIQLAPYGLR